MARKRTKAQVHESEELHDIHQDKTIWHPLALQRVPLGRFVEVVNQILEGKLTVFDSSLKGASSTRNIDGSTEGDRNRGPLPGK
jgi:hypothetical protein